MSAQKAELPPTARLTRKTEHLLMHAEGMLTAFEHMGCGALLLDSSGLVKKMNCAAKSHLGCGISLTNGKLTVSHQTSQRDLDHLIRSATTRGGELGHEHTAVALQRPSGRPLVAQIVPARTQPPEPPSRPWPVLVLIDIDSAHRPSEAVLRSAFALTPAEGRLAAGLAGGRDLRDVAMRLGIRLGTARVHLSNVFAKTGTRSQQELAVLLERLACTSAANTVA